MTVTLPETFRGHELLTPRPFLRGNRTMRDDAEAEDQGQAQTADGRHKRAEFSRHFLSCGRGMLSPQPHSTSLEGIGGK